MISCDREAVVCAVMSFATRSEGLVQRRHVAQSGTTTLAEQNSDDEKRREEEESVDHDSKETRLTLMEEVLLLGLKDREVQALLYNAVEIYK